MGWCSYHATHYKGNGDVDRKAECDELINDENHVVIKSVMVGSVYYAAVRTIREVKRNADGTRVKDADGHYVWTDVPFTEQKVWAAVFKTGKDDAYYNFAYKDMDETCGPCEADCPKSILELLTPTDSEWANQWRQRCYDNLERKKNSKWLTKLPFGSKVRFTFKDKTYILEKSAPGGQFKNWYWYVEEYGQYMPKKYVTADRCELITDNIFA